MIDIITDLIQIIIHVQHTWTPTILIRIIEEEKINITSRVNIFLRYQRLWIIVFTMAVPGCVLT